MNPKTEMDNQIEKTGRAPIVVGRVTPCAPRLQPTYANFPRRRFPEDECHANARNPWWRGRAATTPAASVAPVGGPRESQAHATKLNPKVPPSHEPENRNGQSNRKDRPRAYRGRARHSVRAAPATNVCKFPKTPLSRG